MRKRNSNENSVTGNGNRGGNLPSSYNPSPRGRRMFKFPKGIGIWILVVVCFLSFGSWSLAAIPRMINFQGKITPVPSSGTIVAFNIVGSTWTEEMKVGNGKNELYINPSTGTFNVLLGNITPIPDTIFDGTTRKLNIKVGGVNLSPDQDLVSVPYSFRAEDTEKLAGLNLDQLIARIGESSGSQWKLISGTNNITNINTSGNVGIGIDPDASEKLHVAGNAKFSGGVSALIFKTSNVNISESNVIATGLVKAGSFIGDGSGITGLQRGMEGTGTLNNIPKFTASSSIGNSIITEVDNKIGIGNTAPTEKLDVKGGLKTVADNNGIGVYSIANTGEMSKGGKFEGPLGIEAIGGVTGIIANGGSYGISASGATSGLNGTSQTGYGVIGNSTSGISIYGYKSNDPDNDASPAIYGSNLETNAGDNPGVKGESVKGYGVYGTSATNYGVIGSGNGSGGVKGTTDSGNGVYGLALSAGSGVSGQSISGYGIKGVSASNYGVYANSGTGTGLYARGETGQAGLFKGEVTIDRSSATSGNDANLRVKDNIYVDGHIYVQNRAIANLIDDLQKENKNLKDKLSALEIKLDQFIAEQTRNLEIAKR